MTQYFLSYVFFFKTFKSMQNLDHYLNLRRLFPSAINLVLLVHIHNVIQGAHFLKMQIQLLLCSNPLVLPQICAYTHSYYHIHYKWLSFCDFYFYCNHIDAKRSRVLHNRMIHDLHQYTREHNAICYCCWLVMLQFFLSRVRWWKVKVIRSNK